MSSLFTLFGIMAAVGERDILNSGPKLLWRYTVTDKEDGGTVAKGLKAVYYPGGLIFSITPPDGGSPYTSTVGAYYDVTDATKAYIYYMTEGYSYKLNASTGATVSQSSSSSGGDIAGGVTKDGHVVSGVWTSSYQRFFKYKLSTLSTANNYNVPSGEPMKVCTDSEGRIYILYNSGTGPSDIIKLARLNADFTLDTSFTIVEFGMRSEVLYPVYMKADRDGNIIFAIKNGGVYNVVKKNAAWQTLFTIVTTDASYCNIMPTYDGDIFVYTTFNGTRALHRFTTAGVWEVYYSPTYIPEMFDVNGFSYNVGSYLRQLNKDFAQVWALTSGYSSSSYSVSGTITFETGELGSCANTWW